MAHSLCDRVILVTGGTGLVGRALRAQVAAGSFERSSFVFVGSEDADLCSYAETAELFRKHKPSYVIHLAVRLMAGNEMQKHMADLLITNLSIDTNVLRCAHEFNVQKVISALSSFAYPVNATLPISEEQLHNGRSHELYEPYAMSKRVLETLSRAYRSQFGNNYVTVVPSNIFGSLNALRDSGPVIDALIGKAVSARQSNCAFIVRGTGKPLRQFCYASDLAKVILWMLDNYDDAEPLNVVGEEIAVGEVAKHVARIFGIEDKLTFDATYPDGPLLRTLSDDKLRRLMPTYEQTPFAEAIQVICTQIMKDMDI